MERPGRSPGTLPCRLEPTLAANQRIEDARDGNRQVGGALSRAERYLNLASLAAVLLAGVAVALSAARFAARRFDASALLRCLGLSRREALTLYALQLAILGLAASLVGALLGWLAQLGLFHLLRELLPAEVPSGGFIPALAGIATGLVALAGFALPPWPHSAAYRRCGCCAGTCSPYRPAPGWSTAPPSSPSG